MASAFKPRFKLLLDGTRVRSIEDVRREFKHVGLTFADWARDNGFDAPLVYGLLNGVTYGRYGKSHAIATRLGITSRPPERRPGDRSSLSATTPPI